MINIQTKIKMLIAFCILVSVLFFRPNSHANNITQEQMPTVDTTAVFVKDDLAYIGAGRSLTILDVSVPSTPVMLGKSDTLPNSVKDIDVVGNLAYVIYSSSNYQKGLAIINVNDPTAPSLVGRLDIDGQASYVQVVENIAYIIYGGVGDDVLVMVDVTDPNTPTLIETDSHYQKANKQSEDTIDLVNGSNINHSHGTTGLHVIENTAYTIFSYYGTEGVTAFNITDPNNLSRNFHGHSYSQDGFVQDVYVIDTIAYMAHTTYGLIIMNLGEVDEENPYILSKLEISGTNYDMQLIVKDDIAYLIKRNANLTLIDVSDLTNPTELDTFSTQQSNDMYLSDNKIYIADSEKGLLIVDASNPYSPSLIGSFVPTDEDNSVVNPVFQNNATLDFISHLGGQTEAIFVDDNIGYAGTGHVLTIFDTSNRSSPRILGQSDPFPEQIENIDVVGDIAYLQTDERLLIVDVQNHSAPILLSTFETEEYLLHIDIVEHTAYLSTVNHLLIVDISDINRPTLINSFDEIVVRDLQIVDNIAYIINGASFASIDLNDPYNPSILDSFDTEGNSWDLKIIEDTAYVADHPNGLVTVDISDPRNLRSVGFVETGYATGIDVVGNTAYIASGQDGIVTIDVTDPAVPTILSFTQANSQVSDVTVYENTAYLLHPSYDTYVGVVTILDVSTPSLPEKIGLFGMGGVNDVEVIDNLAYIASWGNGVSIVDLSNPDIPLTLSNLETEGESLDIQVVGNIAYVADYYNGLVILDVGDPYAPIFISSLDTDEAKGLVVVNNTVYIADWNSGLKVIDVSDPFNPIQIGSLEIDGQLEAIQVEGNIAYITNYTGFVTIDISDPTNPILLDFFDTSSAYDIQVVGDTAYIADSYNGIVIVDVTNPSNLIFISRINTGMTTSSIAVDEDILYTNGQDNDTNYALIALDISDLNATHVLASVYIEAFSGSAYMEVIDGIIYMSGLGLNIFDDEPVISPVEQVDPDIHQVLLPFITR